MNTKWIAVLLFLILVAGLAILQETNIIDIRWQMLAIILTGVIAPFKYLLSLFNGPLDKIKDIKNQYNSSVTTDTSAEFLSKEVESLKERIKVLEEKKN